MSENQLQVVEQEMDRSIALYHNASMLVLDEATEAKLTASFDESLIEIRPDGMIYLPQVFWRQRLNQAFGIGQWCLIVKNQTKDPNISKLYVEGVLMVRGAYIATAVGEAEYHESNSNQSWASVWESAKSDCITRCCKDMGIANELWMPQHNREWIGKFGVKVYVEGRDGKKKVQWRHINSQPFYNECGVVPDSPNKPSAQTTRQPAKQNQLPQPNNQQTDRIDLDQWKDEVNKCKTTTELKRLFDSNKETVNKHQEIFNLFSYRKAELLNAQKSAA